MVVLAVVVQAWLNIPCNQFPVFFKKKNKSIYFSNECKSNFINQLKLTGIRQNIIRLSKVI